MSETRSQLAVALHYDRTGAPRVVAKGKGAIGAKIIEVAKAHDIPIEENEVLAGALSNVELGDEIPAELYKAVAEVLVFVLRLTRPARRSPWHYWCNGGADPKNPIILINLPSGPISPTSIEVSPQVLSARTSLQRKRTTR